MDLIRKLAEKVKPELNHIYTGKRLITSRGPDMGWFCREQALHLYGLAVLLGKTAEICTGDFILHWPDGGISFNSVGLNNDHAWCRIEDHAPVDVSITLKYICVDRSDISLIYNNRSDLCAPFQLRYLVNQDDEIFLSLTEENIPLIAYNEKDRTQYDLLELLENPFQFLHKPIAGMPTFPEFYGNDVFYAISYHCYRLVTEDIRPLFMYRDPEGTLKGIMKFNPNARQDINRILESEA